jgi:predicted membrane chloride channel (bestrophin family)
MFRMQNCRHSFWNEAIAYHGSVTPLVLPRVLTCGLIATAICIVACERILNSPLPRICSINVRRFILMFLITLPFALLHRVKVDWLVPLVTMLVAYPLLALDQIGVELQNPFATSHLNHLPLEAISTTIAGNLRSLLKERQSLAMPVQ